MTATSNDVLMGSLARFYTIFGAVVLGGAIFPFMKLRPSYAFLHPYLLHKLAILLIAAIGLYLIAPYWRQVLVRLRANPFLPALVIWMLLSLSWTVAPHARVTILAGLLTGTIFGLFLLLATPRLEMLRLLAISALVIMVLSLIYTYGFGFDEYATNRLRMMAGVYSNKNILVRLACLTIILAVYLLVSHKGDESRDKYMWGVVLLSGLWMVAQYYTLTAKLAVPAAGAAVLLVFAGGKSSKLFIGVSAALAFIAVLGVVFLDQILALARETSGLENRLFHWSQMIQQDATSSWFGAGLGGFWDRLSGPWQTLDLRAPLNHGHNGFIDTWLDLGFIGLFLLLATITFATYRAVQTPFARWSLSAYFGLAIFTVLIIYNLTESSILPTNSANTLLWAIFVALMLAPVAQTNEVSAD